MFLPLLLFQNIKLFSPLGSVNKIVKRHLHAPFTLLYAKAGKTVRYEFLLHHSSIKEILYFHERFFLQFNGTDKFGYQIGRKLVCLTVTVLLIPIQVYSVRIGLFYFNLFLQLLLKFSLFEVLNLIILLFPSFHS